MPGGIRIGAAKHLPRARLPITFIVPYVQCICLPRVNQSILVRAVRGNNTSFPPFVGRQSKATALATRVLSPQILASCSPSRSGVLKQRRMERLLFFHSPKLFPNQLREKRRQNTFHSPCVAEQIVLRWIGLVGRDQIKHVAPTTPTIPAPALCRCCHSSSRGVKLRVDNTCNTCDLQSIKQFLNLTPPFSFSGIQNLAN